MTKFPVLVILLLSLANGWAVRPRVGRCPTGWYANGVRPWGSYECRPALGDPAHDLQDARDRVFIDDDRAIRDRIYCTGGSHPIVVDDVTVGCQR